MLRDLFKHSRLARTLAMMIAVGALPAQTLKAQSSAGGSSSRGADILVFDIVDSVANATRPAMGGGGGGDILVFDIIDSVASATRVLGPGGGDIVVLDIVEN